MFSRGQVVAGQAATLAFGNSRGQSSGGTHRLAGFRRCNPPMCLQDLHIKRSDSYTQSSQTLANKRVVPFLWFGFVSFRDPGFTDAGLRRLLLGNRSVPLRPSCSEGINEAPPDFLCSCFLIKVGGCRAKAHPHPFIDLLSFCQSHFQSTY